MSVKKHENQVYVIDLNLVTKRYTAQTKIVIDHSLNLKLMNTARFISVNDHLSVNKFDIVNSRYSKINNYLSAASLR